MDGASYDSQLLQLGMFPAAFKLQLGIFEIICTGARKVGRVVRARGGLGGQDRPRRLEPYGNLGAQHITGKLALSW